MHPFTCSAHWQPIAKCARQETLESDPAWPFKEKTVWKGSIRSTDLCKSWALLITYHSFVMQMIYKVQVHFSTLVHSHRHIASTNWASKYIVVSWMPGAPEAECPLSSEILTPNKRKYANKYHERVSTYRCYCSLEDMSQQD